MCGAFCNDFVGFVESQQHVRGRTFKSHLETDKVDCICRFSRTAIFRALQRFRHERGPAAVARCSHGARTRRCSACHGRRRPWWDRGRVVEALAAPQHRRRPRRHAWRRCGRPPSPQHPWWRTPRRSPTALRSRRRPPRSRQAVVPRGRRPTLRGSARGPRARRRPRAAFGLCRGTVEAAALAHTGRPGRVAGSAAAGGLQHRGAAASAGRWVRQQEGGRCCTPPPAPSAGFVGGCVSSLAMDAALEAMA